MKLTEDLEASEREKMYLMPDNRIVIPLNLLWEVVRKEHKTTHCGADALYKDLNKRIVRKSLHTTVKQATEVCEICLRNNPNTTCKVNFGKTGKGNILGQHWQTDFFGTPTKSGVLLFISYNRHIFQMAFSCRTNKAQKVV